MSTLKPCTIKIEWNGTDDFCFSCDYRPSEKEGPGRRQAEAVQRSFPVMVRALGNVKRKLRREHISFPMFLVALAFNHARLLDEIDQLLTLLHNHIDEAEGEGRFSCSISSSTIPPSSSSSG